MVNGENSCAFAAQFLQNACDGLLGHFVDIGERLVKQHDVGALHQRASHEHALSLSAREFADGFRSRILKTDECKRGKRFIACGASNAAKEPEPTIQTHRNHIERASGEGPVDLGSLRQIGHP